MTRNEPGVEPALYDADFFTWTQRQAAALRAMPRDAAFDIEHVAEEIGDLGKSELNRALSFLGLVLQHLVELHAAPTSRDAAHWYQETSNFQASARRSFSPGMRQSIDLDEAWADARRATRRFLDEIGHDAGSWTGACPFTLDELLAKGFDVDAAIGSLGGIGTGMTGDDRPRKAVPPYSSRSAETPPLHDRHHAPDSLDETERPGPLQEAVG